MSPQFLSGNCPDVNGAIINSYLGTVWEKLPRTNPARAQAQLLQKMIKRDVSNFDVDTGTALWTFKAAIERGGFTRAAINTAIETKLKGFVTPGGKLRFSTNNHTGLNIDSMWAGPDHRLPAEARVRRRVRSHQVAPSAVGDCVTTQSPTFTMPTRCPPMTPERWRRPERGSATPPRVSRRATGPTRRRDSGRRRAEDQLCDRSTRAGDPKGDQRASPSLWLDDVAVHDAQRAPPAGSAAVECPACPEGVRDPAGDG